MNKPYQPINCEFHDILESNCVKRSRCEISFVDEQGNEKTVSSVIVNVFAKNKEEFIQLENDTLVRLDRLISVDGEMIRNY